jgi:hypothetical protein
MLPMTISADDSDLVTTSDRRANRGMAIQSRRGCDDVSMFLQRYEAGEREQVWAELTDLGEAVFEEEYHADAVAVAEVTMGRVAANISTLVERMNTMGYRYHLQYRCNELLREGFDGDRLRADAVQFGEDPSWIDTGADEYTLRWVPRNGARPDSLARAARVTSPLPLALVAMWRIVGTVGLSGSFRSWDPSACLFEDGSDWPDVGVYAEPIELRDEWSLLGYCDETTDTITSGWIDGDRFWVPIGPDSTASAGFSGGCHTVALPDRCADPVLVGVDHRPGIRLVEYLRVCFQWGGFPGFEFERSVPPEIAILRQDLLPI